MATFANRGVVRTARDRSFRYSRPAASTASAPTVVACERCGSWTGVKPLCYGCRTLDQVDADAQPKPPVPGLTLVEQLEDGTDVWEGPLVGVDGKPVPPKRDIPASALHGQGSPEMEGAEEAYPAAARRLGFGESDVLTEGAWKGRR